MWHVGVMPVVTSEVGTSARSILMYVPDLRSAEVRMNTLQVPDIYNTYIWPSHEDAPLMLGSDQLST